MFHPALVRNEAQSYYGNLELSYWHSIHAGCLDSRYTAEDARELFLVIVSI